MNNNDVFPFIRNNYYKGKQLTARDFNDEQKYQTDKLRAMRRFLCGTGVVSGLDVVAVDDSSYSVESGYAFDSNGHDIIVGTPVLKKLEATEGYDEIDFNKSAYLCIEYSETPHEASAPLYDSSRTEYNRTKEGFRIYLTNRKPVESVSDPRSIIETRTVLYSTDKVRVTMTVPRYVNIDEKLIVTVSVEKRGLNESLAADLKIDHEGFLWNGEGSSTFSYYNATEVYDVRTESIALSPLKKSIGLSCINVRSGALSVTVGEDIVKVPIESTFVTEIIEGSVEERVKQEYFFHSVDDSGSVLCLAELFLSGTAETPRIERVIPLPFGQYVFSDRLAYLLNSLPKQPERETVVAAAPVGRQTSEKDNQIHVASGVESIDISSDYRGKVYYSSEIVHGLGEGNISYSIGFECLDDFSGNDSTVMFGDPSLFANSPYEMRFPNVQYSIISYNDKGTFRVAVKLLERVNSGNIVLHWHAVKTEEKSAADMIEIEKVSISIKPNLVNIEPRETVSLECVIEGCDNLNCIWNVEDKNGGTISKNGIYKAPSTEGVYTVTATSVKYPTKKAVNYIIVSKRKEV
ncbi:MAG: hypothetical protein ACI4Q4_04315 [Oscillospiraceae bacterium]